MTKIVRRDDAILLDSWQEMLETESHHDHNIIETNKGFYRWQESTTHKLLDEYYNLNNVVGGLIRNGYTKNSEEWRQLYRDMGYSLYGYWEIFYCELNNPDFEDYKQPIGG